MYMFLQVVNRQVELKYKNQYNGTCFGKQTGQQNVGLLEKASLPNIVYSCKFLAK